MSKAERIKVIEEWEVANSSKVIVYFLGDRPGMETRIGNDVYPFFYDILSNLTPTLKRTDKLDLIIYSTGGMTVAGFAIANLIYEFVDKFNVVIPYKAHSSATLLTLGAREIYMSKLAQLTPIDPSVNSPYNPPGQNVPNAVNLLPVPVEDCVGYLDLAKKQAGLGKDLKDVFLSLSNKIHPMALGAVFRAREQIKQLAKKLLEKNITVQKTVDKIIDMLTKDLFSHDYLISMSEAKKMGLNIVDIDEAKEKLIWKIFETYKNDLKLSDIYNAEKELGAETNAFKIYERAYIESKTTNYSFITKKQVEKINITRPGNIPDVAIRERILSEGWEKL